MDVLAYDGFQFSDLTGMSGGLTADGANRWSINTSVVPRGSGDAMLGTGQPSPRIIDVEFTYNGSEDDLYDVFGQLIGRLNPADQSSRRKLVAELPDGTEVWRYARITEPSGWPQAVEVNTAIIRFISADPKWYKTEARTVAPFADSRVGTDTSAIILGPNTPGIALPNTGYAEVQPTLRIYTGGAYPGSGGWTYRRRLTISNDLTRTVTNHVALVSLGDTSALVSGGKALSSGNDLRVIGPDGLEVPRNLVAWNHTGSWMYVYVDNIPAGESVDYWIVYGNASAGSPDTLTYPYTPAFRTDCVAGTAIGAGSTTTEIHITAGSVVGFPAFSPTSNVDDYYVDALIYFTSGANAGLSRRITSNEWDSFNTRHEFTLASALTNSPSATDDWVIITSRNGVWMYNTINDIERGFDTARGRWYLDSTEGYPSIVDYDVPGAWKPHTYYPTRDRYGNPGYTRISNGGDSDPYALLDAYRTYENGTTAIVNEGVADGVSISLPFPITGYDSNCTLINPNGMAKGIVGVRAFGSSEWQILDDEDTVAASTAWTPNISISGNINQVYHGLIPYEGEEITQKWRRDSGSTTSAGTTTTIVDATKAWRADQWIGYFVRFTGGRRSGQVYTITDNTTTQLTIGTTLGTATKIDQSYEIFGADTYARLLDGDRCTLTWDDSDLDISSLGSEEFCTDLSARFWIGGGKDSSSVLLGHRRAALEVGKDADSFVLVKDSSTYHLHCDSATRTAVQYNTLNGDVVERYTPHRIEWLATNADGIEAQSANGLPVPPNLPYVITNPAAATNTNGWTVSYQAGLTGTFQRSTTRYAGEDHDGNAYATSFQLIINSNTGGPIYADVVCNDRFAINEGGLAVFSAFVRCGNTAYDPLLGIRFYDALSGGSTVSTETQSAGTYSANVWYTEAFAAEAPATTLSWSPLIRCYIASGTTLSDIHWTGVDPSAPVLFAQSDHDIGQFNVEYTEGFWQ